MFDARTNLSTEVAAEVRRHLGSSVYTTVDARAASGCRRRRATACPSLCTDPNPRVRTPTARSPANSSVVTGATGPTAAAGTPSQPPRSPSRPRRDRSRRSTDDGPTWRAPVRPWTRPGVADPRPGRCRRGADRDPARSDRREPLPAPALDGRRRARGPRRKHRRARRPAADPRDGDAGGLPARGRRASCARRPPGRPRRGSPRWSASSPTEHQLELALVENMQRADLNAIEEAHAYRQLIDEFGFTQEEIARKVGRARSTVANTLRLLDLDPSRPGGSRRRQHHRGPCPRDGRPRRSPAGRPPRDRRRPGPVGAPGRGARPAPPDLRPDGRRNGADQADPDASESRKTSASPWAPRCRLPGRAGAAGS